MPALGLILAFKVASTLDSMFGYRSPELLAFGWASARLDDMMNFLPARLSLLVLFFGAWMSSLHPLEWLRTALRDRLKHDSPNAAHAKSYFAGTLGVRLCGPLVYHGRPKHKPWLGNGNTDPDPEDIRRAVLLVMCSGWIAVLLSVAAFVVFG